VSAACPMGLSDTGFMVTDGATEIDADLRRDCLDPADALIPKLIVRVRFPSPAQRRNPRSAGMSAMPRAMTPSSHQTPNKVLSASPANPRSPELSVVDQGGWRRAGLRLPDIGA
jgi:hypothetical protein